MCQAISVDARSVCSSTVVEDRIYFGRTNTVLAEHRLLPADRTDLRATFRGEPHHRNQTTNRSQNSLHIGHLFDARRHGHQMSSALFRLVSSSFLFFFGWSIEILAFTFTFCVRLRATLCDIFKRHSCVFRFQMLVHSVYERNTHCTDRNSKQTNDILHNAAEGRCSPSMQIDAPNEASLKGEIRPKELASGLACRYLTICIASNHHFIIKMFSMHSVHCTHTTTQVLNFLTVCSPLSLSLYALSPLLNFRPVVNSLIEQQLLKKMTTIQRPSCREQADKDLMCV